MALPSGTPTIRAGQAVSANGTAPQEAARLQEAFLCGLPIWQNDQETLEGQGRQQTNNESGHPARAGCLSGPARVQLPRANRPTEGQTNATTLQIRHRFRGPVLRIHICLSSMAPHERRNGACQTCL